MTKIAMLYVPCLNLDEAKSIARELLGEKLIACANFIPNMQSIYEWQGQIEENSECCMIVKTTQKQLALVREKILSLHSYECPCVLEIDISSINTLYEDWVLKQIKQ